MSIEPALAIFSTPFHNPSIYDVRSHCGRGKDLIDFCVPANSYFPPPRLLELIKDNLGEVLKYYPDYSSVHQENLARIADVSPEYIVPANGVTELITILCKECPAPILTDTPTFGRWTDLPQLYDVPVRFLERHSDVGFKLTVDEICERVTEVGARTLVLSNPSNPTGAWSSYAEMAELMERLPESVLLIVDESFIEFSGIDSVEKLVVRSPNAIVVKSLGKALGWHGVRLGYGVANTHMAEHLRSRTPYWNINGLAAFVLKHLGEFIDEYRASFALVARDRDYMYSQLKKVPDLITYESRANFILSELPAHCSGRLIRDRLLLEHGLFVRECSNKVGSSEKFLRNVVRTRGDVDRLAAALGALLGMSSY